MKNNKKIIIYGVILLVVFVVSIVGTYAYYSFSVSNNSVIAGSVSSINATLDVELVVGSNNQMVPMNDNALTNALVGTGGVSPCIDSNNNLSCQVYKITLTNRGAAINNLNGKITLEANSGSTYNNLKWQELTLTNTTYSPKSGSSANGMTGGKLVTNGTLAVSEVKVWYIAVWIHETGNDQSNTDRGTFKGTVTFNNEEQKDLVTYLTNQGTTTYVDTEAGVDFSKTSEQNNTNGLYLLSITQNDTNPIYYYRGAVDNNLLYAGFCWKIVRTTEYGGLKLIYNGVPSNGTCNNTGTNSQLASTSAFNSSYNANAYVGYMYGSTSTSATYANTHKNTTNSTIKTAIDNWYSTNMTSHTSELEPVVFCNDRSLDSGTGIGTTTTYYNARKRLYTNKTPSLECPNASNDLFSTASASVGNKALTYPVGLITADEVAMAGAVYNASNSSYYLYTGQNWCTCSPYVFGSNAFEFRVNSDGRLSNFDVDNTFGVRPVVSLASGYSISGGNGGTSSPFIVE